MATDNGFTRDFGYLFPFLDKVQQVAARLSPPERDRLRVLMEGERAKWEEIRGLLMGAKVETATSPPPSPELSQSLTVGTLKPPPRR